MTCRAGTRSGALLAAAVGLLWAFAPRTVAQDSDAPSPEHDLLMTAGRAEAVRRAWNERLTYVPGEVLVSFRNGVDSQGRVPALASMRAGVGDRDARWIGDVLWVRAVGDDGVEPDAAHLAATLERQPEVAWAQPNYVWRTHARPNDPSYSRQWNLDLINMPLAGHQRRRGRHHHRRRDRQRRDDGHRVVCVFDLDRTAHRRHYRPLPREP